MAGFRDGRGFRRSQAPGIQGFSLIFTVEIMYFGTKLHYSNRVGNKGGFYPPLITEPQSSFRSHLCVAICLLVCISFGLVSASTRCPAQSVTHENEQASPGRYRWTGSRARRGFFQQLLRNPQIEIVGIVEPDAQLVSKYAAQYGLDRRLFSSDLEEMLTRAHPKAVLVYTNTYDHRRVVEICARHGVHVMMEKPLAVSFEDALAIEKAARTGKIQVLVNYETTWYASNRAAYDLVHDKALGEVRKVVVHDGHRGPKEIGVGPEFLSWLTDPKLNGGGALFDFGCYGADLMTWLMDGERPQTVTAVTQQIKPDVYPRVDDEATIILTYPKARPSCRLPGTGRLSARTWKYTGKKDTRSPCGGMTIRVRRGENSQSSKKAAKNKLRLSRCQLPYDNSLSYLRAVLSGRNEPRPPVIFEINLTVTEILDAARRSAATGKTIRLASVEMNTSYTFQPLQRANFSRGCFVRAEKPRGVPQKIGRHQRMLTYTISPITSPASPCRCTAASTARNAYLGFCAIIPATMPVKISPVPPVAMPGLPVVLTHASPSGRTTSVRWPLAQRSARADSRISALSPSDFSARPQRCIRPDAPSPLDAG